MKSEKKKMRAGVFVKPETTKGKIIGLIFLLIIICSSVPVINLVNKPDLVFGGIPVLFAWTMGIIVSVILVLRLALAWEVH